jgi:hypothetical protein
VAITRLSWIKILCTALGLRLNANRRLMFICAVVATPRCHRYIHTARHCGDANAGSLTCCSEYSTNTPVRVLCISNRMYPIRLLSAYPNEVAQRSEYAVTCTNTSRFHSAAPTAPWLPPYSPHITSQTTSVCFQKRPEVPAKALAARGCLFGCNSAPPSCTHASYLLGSPSKPPLRSASLLISSPKPFHSLLTLTISLDLDLAAHQLHSFDPCSSRPSSS